MATPNARSDAVNGQLRRQRRGWVLLALAVLTLQLFIAIDWLLLAGRGPAAAVQPPGLSFTIFWSAAWLALHGHAADAYTLDALSRVEHTVVPWLGQALPWFYPLPYLLLLLPLALLPYGLAYASFMLMSLAALLWTLRRHLPGSAWLGLWAAPALWSNLLAGQNGLLTAALGTTAALTLEHAPRRAGMLIGLLAIKPQLALLFPLALLAARAWPALLSAAATALALQALALLGFGVPAWSASVAAAHAARVFLEHAAPDWPMMPTSFVMLRQLGIGVAPAYALQAAVAVACAALVWRVWRRSADPEARAAVLLAAAPLATPYLFHYDLAWLAFPLLWCARAGCRDGWRRGERALLLTAWLLPLLLPLLLAWRVSLPLAPVVLGLLLAHVARRALSR